VTARKAKIVCTIGPASDDAATIEALVRAGMDVARLNFSHGDAAAHERRFRTIRAAADRAGRPVAILQDLQGPKIRTGRMRGGEVLLRAGDEVTITTRDVEGDAGRFGTTYAGLPADVEVGQPVLLADGRIRLEVLERRPPDELRARVRIGGPLKSSQGINLPGTRVSAPSLTDKDRRDLALGLALGVDYVALSFVRSAADVRAAKALVGDTPLVAKIEKPEALGELDEIAAEADALMVARGDLGVELPLEQVPLEQKAVIERTNAAAKVPIVATEMLESMIERSRPTRAEVSDIANAILDGAGAVMLSAETASGRYPVEAVATMDAVIREVERSARFRALPSPVLARSESFPLAVARATVAAADQLGVATVVALTETGRTARLISEHRPSSCGILGLSADPRTLRRMALYWGVEPLAIPAFRDPEEMLRIVSDAVLATGIARCGETVVIASGFPGRQDETHQMTLHKL
jgi:pyruvate kinase